MQQTKFDEKRELGLYVCDAYKNIGLVFVVQMVLGKSMQTSEKQRT
ncbi:hypothetical protein ORM30_23965 [Bacillus cereus]|nr:hypothetical protein [Bacillus cereus]